MATSYTNLKIFRGTSAQIIAKVDTGLIENMTFYLSTDTNQLFIGGPGTNQLIEYSGNLDINKVGLEQLQEDITSDLDLALTQIGALGQADISLTNSITGVSDRVTTIEAQLNNLDQTVTDKIIELAPSALGENYATKLYVDNESESIRTFVGDTFYTRLQVDNAIISRISDENNNLVSRNTFDNAVLSMDSFKTVELANTTSILEDNISNFFAPEAKEDGIYKIVVNYGSGNLRTELLIKNGVNLFRFNEFGIALDRNKNEILGTKINNINGITTTDGEILITADNIPDTNTRKWNSLVPGANGAVNPGGREENSIVGVESISIGKFSTAEAVRSTSIGFNANSLESAQNSIQLGEGSVGAPDIFQVWEYKLLDKTTGKIPSNRIPIEGKLLTLLSGNAWTTIPGDDGHLQQSLPLNGLQLDSLLWTSPNEETYEDFVDYEVRAVSQSLNTITFKCAKINLAGPTSNIKVDVIVRY